MGLKNANHLNVRERAIARATVVRRGKKPLCKPRGRSAYANKSTKRQKNGIAKAIRVEPAYDSGPPWAQGVGFRRFPDGLLTLPLSVGIWAGFTFTLTGIPATLIVT